MFEVCVGVFLCFLCLSMLCLFGCFWDGICQLRFNIFVGGK